MPIFEFEKIVRDDIPENMIAAGGLPVMEVLSKDGIYKRLIDDKLAEEVREIKKASTDVSRASEIADAIDVLYGAALQLGYDEARVDEIRSEKTAKAGAFSHGRYIIQATVPDDYPWIQHFRDNPDDYPEAK